MKLLSKNLFLTQNKICILQRATFISNNQDQGPCYRLDLDILSFNQYTRRKEPLQIEVITKKMIIYILVPAEISFDQHNNFIDSNWFNYLISKDNGSLIQSKFLYSRDETTGDTVEQFELYTLYWCQEDTQTFNNISETYSFVVINYDIKPSILNINYYVKARDGEKGTLNCYNYFTHQIETQRN